MLTFEELLHNTAEKGGSINIMFEQKLCALVGTLQKVVRPLAHESIPYELIGGGAVMVHVDRVEKSAVRSTKDIDIMIHRADLERVKRVLAQNGFTVYGDGDILLAHGEANTENVVRIVFTAENVRPKQAILNPPLRPEQLIVGGVEVAVITVLDLVHMKLSNNRDIDRVHIRDLDSVGLIPSAVESALPSMLRVRLQEIRARE